MKEKEVVEVNAVKEVVNTVKARSLNEAIMSIRVKLQNAKIEKSGFNPFAKFKYFELADFLPKLNELMLEEGINDLYSIKDGEATLTLIRDNGEKREEQVYSMPFVMFETPINIRTDRNTGEAIEVKSMQDIQYLGALNTYYKRYLYLNAFGITDGEVIDGMDNTNEKPKKPTDRSTAKATDKQLARVKQLVDDIPAMLEYYRIEKLEDLTLFQASEIIAKKGK